MIFSGVGHVSEGAAGQPQNPTGLPTTARILSGSQVGPARFGTRKELGCGSASLSHLLEPTPARDTPSP